MSMITIEDLSPSESRERTVLVLLPGAYMTAQDFVTHGLIDAVRRRSWPVDVIAVETGMDSYLENNIVDRLHDEVISPARAAGAQRIWLGGISLGAMGALLYAQRHREAVAGLLLLSPFIGSRGIVAEIDQAGGIRNWRPETAGELPVEHRLLKWLKPYKTGDPRWPAIHLAFGRDDRFAAAHRILAEILPTNNVLIGDGGHDWATWEKLWERLMQTAPFGVPAGTEI